MCCCKVDAVITIDVTWLSTLTHKYTDSAKEGFSIQGMGDLVEKLRDVQLHTFTDACRLGYGAVSYLHLVNVNNQLTSNYNLGFTFAKA